MGVGALPSPPVYCVTGYYVMRKPSSSCIEHLIEMQSIVLKQVCLLGKMVSSIGVHNTFCYAEFTQLKVNADRFNVKTGIDAGSWQNPGYNDVAGLFFAPTKDTAIFAK